MSHTLPRQVRYPGASGVGCDLLPHKRDKVIKCEVKEGIMEQARLCVPTGFGLSFFRVVYFTELEVEVPVRSSYVKQHRFPLYRSRSKMSATVSQGINLDLQNHSVNTPTSSTGEKTYRYAQQEIF